MSASCRKVWKYTQPLKRLGIFLSIGGELFLILKNITTNMVISENITIADNFFKRFKGLMFTKELSPQCSLYIYPCSTIHTFFMNYAIDVLYLDIHHTILAIDEDMKPGKIGKHRKGIVSVIELPSGKVKETNTKIGQVVSLFAKGEVKI